MSGSTGDESYMAMLNNPVINPGPSTNTNLEQEQKANTNIKPCVFPAVEEAKNLLTKATENICLSSESDEAFEWINTEIKQENLPTTKKELAQLGLISHESLTGSLTIKSLQEFLYEDNYKGIVAAFQTIQNEKACDSKVYLLGERSVIVLILCIVQDKQSSKKAIVGLKSLLVQT
ncbi:hypothetical protein BD408DRAFT_411588 [Parasitella parasitica]|nr:hypothetical protein BD408DRAFT_411588 [Parasitella parasitica]